ncbi:type 1 glutamine amidotransferase domain-containing protein [Flavihumibacter sp. CACIAM 22H1]|uniref:type 1 glutamine amidotransferase domain-containing protein n=1 Tax=Flavihumibacter sp. CACIAM 22H1 TaxID=1812911 RepID=UPI000AD47E1E|nr:type 1 glutamine amidotransferase domain-containing protein [Flavihumibacter sp. CACIAM 22H1]
MKFLFPLLLIPVLLISAFSSKAQPNKKTKVLFVLTSHNKLGKTGHATGFWIEEFATPYYYFTDKGIEVEIATPNGGQAPIDPKSNEPSFQTASTKRYFADAATQNLLATTKKLTQVREAEYAAIFYPGGHGPMWDLANDINSIKLIQSFYYNNKPIAFVCHGSAALVNVKDNNGNYLVSGKELTSFCNSEEEAVELSNIVPFALESKLKERGAIYRKGPDWSSYVAEDGQLITGQNPQSSEEVAKKLYTRLKKK